MERLAKMILSVVDLAEVEAKSLKRGAIRFCFALVFTVAGGILGVIGLCLVLAAGYIALDHAIGTIASLASIGAVFLAVAAYLLISAWYKDVHQASDPAVASGPTGIASSKSSVPKSTVTAAAPSSVAEGGSDDPSLRIAS